MKNLTDFRKTVETGMDPRLGFTGKVRKLLFSVVKRGFSSRHYNIKHYRDRAFIL